MKRTLLTLLFLLTGMVLLGCGARTAGEISAIIRKAGADHAPDSRLAVWDISARRNGGTWVLQGETTSRTGLQQVVHAIKERFPEMEIGSRVTVLSDPALGDSVRGLVTVTVANLRRQPSRQAELVSQTVMGAPVDLLKRRNGFYFCRLEDGYLGWLPDESVRAGDTALVQHWQDDSLLVFREKYGSVYREPRMDSPPVTDMVMVARVRQVETRGDWLKVRLPDGHTGFLPRDQVLDIRVFRSAAPDGPSLVHTARSMLGIPYLWGGTSTKAFDCSGFTQTVFRMHGLALPRDASMQAQQGVPVDTADGFAALRTGDLLFFGSARDHITHVGMYLGDGRYIHESGRVKINSLSPDDPDFNPARARTLRMVKRMF